jgi:cellulose synthase/poly-beta-1,6-N-acetylglucosamine synthase-like glycosyltransferase
MLAVIGRHGPSGLIARARFGYARAMALTALWILVFAAGAGLGWWLLVAIRVLRDLPRIPRAPEGLSLPVPDPAPLVSVIVPAHDEEAHAARAARSILASDWPRLELIMVLDRCTDGTRASLEPIAAADPRLRIVDNHECPPDWAGKCNAARVGARHATGELLLFTDADVEFHRGLVRATVALLRARGLSLLSLLATPRVRHWFEAVVQPVAALMLMRMYPIPRVNDARNPRSFANGQFMLFERSMYERLGGHAIVRDDLLEDIAFARRVRDAGGRGGLCTAEHLLSVEMYETMGEFHRGWKRIYIEAAERMPSRLRALALEWLLGGVCFPAMAIVALLAGVALGGGSLEPLAGATAWMGAASLATFLLVTAWLHRMCHAPAAAAIFHPFGAWLVAHCMLEASVDLERRRAVRWGGREYVLEPRPEGGYGPPPAPLPE